LQLLLVLFVALILTYPESNGQAVGITHEKKIFKEINGQDLAVDVFYASQIIKESNNPAIAFFHGGGWVFGSPEEFHAACERYAKKGFVTFSFQYRLSINEDGTYPNPDISPIESVMDARSAVRWLRENSDPLNIDPDDAHDELRKDLFTPKDSTFNELVRALLSSVGDRLASDSDVAEKIASNLGLELKEEEGDRFGGE